MCIGERLVCKSVYYPHVCAFFGMVCVTREFEFARSSVMKVGSFGLKNCALIWNLTFLAILEMPETVYVST